MLVNVKDIFKLIGVMIICFCAVFVCTIFLNFYIDAQQLEGFVTEFTRPLFDAQLVTAKVVVALAGGVLGVVAVITLLFYVKLYIDSHLSQLGILKALGYSAKRLSVGFSAFGLSVLVGTAVGFGAGCAASLAVYPEMQIEGLPNIILRFHGELLALLVFLPSAIFSLIACIYSYFSLKRPALSMIRGQSEKKLKTARKSRGYRQPRSFFVELCAKTVGSRKAIAFFVALSAFCFAAMIQMAFSMREFTSVMMDMIILLSGIVLAVTACIMSAVSLVSANSKGVAIMKTLGYNDGACLSSMLCGYIPFLLLGFAVGTVYQYVLLHVMVNIVFAKSMPETFSYSFSGKAFGITVAAFAAFIALVVLYTYLKLKKISVKEVMAEL